MTKSELVRRISKVLGYTPRNEQIVELCNIVSAAMFKGLAELVGEEE